MAGMACVCGAVARASRAAGRVAFAEWTRPRVSRHAFIEVVPAGKRGARVRRALERGARRLDRASPRVRAAGAAAQRGTASATASTCSPATSTRWRRASTLDVRRLPLRLRPLVWMSGGRIRWRTVQTVLDAGYVDGFRMKHADDPGLTLPTSDPAHPASTTCSCREPFSQRVAACDVVRHPQAAGGLGSLSAGRRPDSRGDVGPVRSAADRRAVTGRRRSGAGARRRSGCRRPIVEIRSLATKMRLIPAAASLSSWMRWVEAPGSSQRARASRCASSAGSTCDQSKGEAKKAESMT